MPNGTLARLLVANFMMGVAAAQATALAGHWALDETSGTTASDMSTFGNQGTLVNMAGSAWGVAMHGNGLSFDGVDDYVDVNVQGALPIYGGSGAPYSVCFWVKALPQNDKRCYSEGSATAGVGVGPLFTLGSGRTSNGTTDRVQVFLRNDALQFRSMYSTAVAFDDTWHHVAWVDEAGRAVMYIDGVPDATNFDYTAGAIGTLTSAYGTYSINEVSLGAVLRTSACCFLTGALDDVRVYSFALDATDVAAVIANAPAAVCRPSIASFGPGCNGALDLQLTGSAQLGGPGLTLQISGGPPGGLALLCFGADTISPQSLAGFGFPGCTVYPQGPGCVVMGVLPSSGATGAITLPVPATPGLLCGRFAWQAAAIHGMPATLTLSSAALVQLGF